MLTAITLDPSMARLMETRILVADVLTAANVPVSVAERVVLAVSELVTNAVQHGPAEEIRVDIEVEGDEIELRVEQRAGGGSIPHPEFWRLPEDRSQLCGRGLAIVAAVSDRVEVTDDGQIVAVLARFIPRLPGPLHN